MVGVGSATRVDVENLHFWPFSQLQVVKLTSYHDFGGQDDGEAATVRASSSSVNRAHGSETGDQLNETEDDEMGAIDDDTGDNALSFDDEP